MAQLILAARSARRPTDEVLAVLADGVHPGRKVVIDPGVWNSTPLPNYRIVHVPGADPAGFANLLEPPVVDPLVNGRGQRKRLLRLDLTGPQIAELAQNRHVTIEILDVRVSSNPVRPVRP